MEGDVLTKCCRCHPHSDIGFQLHSVPKLRRKVRERKGGRVRGKVLFNIVHQCTLVNYDYCNLDLD